MTKAAITIVALIFGATILGARCAGAETRDPNPVKSTAEASGFREIRAPAGIQSAAARPDQMAPAAADALRGAYSRPGVRIIKPRVQYQPEPEPEAAAAAPDAPKPAEAGSTGKPPLAKTPLASAKPPTPAPPPPAPPPATPASPASKAKPRGH